MNASTVGNRVAKLIMVAINDGSNKKMSAEQSNKYYNMVDNGDGTFTATWGRVGVTSDSKIYPINKWDSTIKSKLKKGYKDITELCVLEEKSSNFVDISDAKIAKLIENLQKFANQLINKTYLIGADSVTSKQIEEAQNLINELISIISLKNQEKFNKTLMHLYTVIPRKMKNVKDHIIDEWDIDNINNILSNEQDNLDAMESQVKTLQLQQDNKEKTINILDALGIEIYHTTDKEKNLICDLMYGSKNNFSMAYRVVKKSTETRFNKWIDGSKNKERSLLFHGSRNSNWLNIIQSGLLIKPANVIHAGSMFGNGIYFANKARKSIGYTSLDGSYWARGNERVAYMGIYDVNVGKPFVIKTNQYSHGSLNEKTIKDMGCDSVHAMGKENGGLSLQNDEIIVYNIAQNTIRFLVELVYYNY